MEVDSASPEPSGVTPQEAISKAEAFLEPALAYARQHPDQTTSISSRLANDELAQREALEHACQHLTAIHQSLLDAQRMGSKQVYDSTLLTTVYSLIDFILLEALYPRLPEGAGNPLELRKRALFWKSMDRNYTVPPDNGTFYDAIRAFRQITRSIGEGLEPLLRNRALKHIIVLDAFLILSRNDWEQLVGTACSFSDYIVALPTDALMTEMSALVKANAPSWLKNPLTSSLSHLPLRPDGVRSVFEYLARARHRPNTQPETDIPTPSKGPTFTLEVLQDAARLLSSVPSTMTAKTWLAGIGPQLFALLDAGGDMSKAAAYVIVFGILSKKALGASNAPGWTTFALPIRDALYPTAPLERSPPDLSDLEPVVVPEATLHTALRRLLTLVHSHPHPAVAKRLVGMCRGPLWAIAAYDKSPVVAAQWSDLALRLLARYISLFPDSDPLLNVFDSMLWDGAAEWEFAPGDQGGIAIRVRTPEGNINLEALQEKIERRIGSFLKLVEALQLDAQKMAELLLAITRRWLSAEHREGKSPIQNLARTALAQALLEKHLALLSSSPIQALTFISSLLRILGDQPAPSDPALLMQPESPAYANIISDWPEDPSKEALVEQREDMMFTALSVMNAVLAAPLPVDPKLETTLKDIEDNMRRAWNMPYRLQWSARITNTIKRLSALREKLNTTQTPTAPPYTKPSFLESLPSIRTQLSSDQPPIRRSALATLDSLLTPEANPDTQLAATLLTSLLLSEPESFVYLPGISSLRRLASLDPRRAANTLVDALSDPSEAGSVDGRLRVAEALIAVVPVLAGSTEGRLAIPHVAEVAIKVAGRRGRREREASERVKAERLARRKRKEAERAWGGEVPEVPDLEDGYEEEEGEAAREKRRREIEAIQRIVRGWEDTGFEEDVRVRASALGVLAGVFENGGGGGVVGSAVDLVLSVLVIETGTERAVLRRAAAMVLLGLVNGMDGAYKRGEQPYVLAAEKWSEVRRVVEWVSAEDGDDVVRDHAETVKENLEAVAMIGVLAEGEMERRRVEEFGKEGLRGLSLGESGGRAGIEEVE
ncbi:hypothetical protein EJ06DRAFT_394477 [Trichodelitschia bisporula]|uniref:RNA polymerase II assembly factor Rtp1 C-terminal domain-containing protein n=1 Tax=Trichodelitschia bisporula TaxID=703511 RepID=A0A6G1I061_9PEZI|nr:hypothetical protein EJ06DRAFT_394477 [Trichodelitschia bisporula]